MRACFHILCLATVLSAFDAAAQPGLDLEQVVRTTLDRSVDVLDSRELIQLREAELEMAEAAFDPVLALSAEGGRSNHLFTGAERAAYEVPSAVTGLSSYRLAVNRLMRSGLTISPGVDVTRYDALTLDEPAVVRTEASVVLIYPLTYAGRGSPESHDAAAASASLSSAQHAAQHARALSLYRAATAYWVYVGAFEALGILTEAQEKAERLLDETQALVEGGERASGDLDQLRADLADRLAAGHAAEQRLFEARQQLGREMGLRAEDAAMLPQPTTGFPDATRHTASKHLVVRATEGRADLAAAAAAVEASASARSARRMASRPRLDVRISLGYAGLSEDHLSLRQHLPPFGQNEVSGANAFLALSLAWPTSNRRARGALERQDAVLRRARLAHDDLVRGIQSGIRIAQQQLRSTSIERARMEEAVELYAAAVENERTKVQLGMATQFDLILAEERLRNSRLALLSSRVQYARAVARFRFETGTMLADDDPPGAIARRLLSPASD